MSAEAADTVTAEELARLEAAAKAALDIAESDPGRWIEADYLNAFIDGDDGPALEQEDTAFIALASPGTVLRLLDAARVTAGTLDEAWAAAEVALPEGWGVGIQPVVGGYSVGASAGTTWTVEATAYGDNALAAALLALAAALRGVPA